MLLDIYTLLVIIIISSCAANVQPTEELVVSKHYGENCSELEEESCNAKETLTCVNQTCHCANHSTMTYDTSRGLCVGRAGHECVRHPSETSVSPGKRNQCVIYSSCEIDEDTKNSTCQCWSSFYPDEDGSCIRRREYLQKCERDEHCNSRKGFECNLELGICTCDPKVTVFNPDTERCVGLPNQECSNVYRECTDNHKCKSGICRCKFKEVEAANGTVFCDPIRHKYGKPCGRYRGDCGNESMNNLRCLDGKCRCKNPDYQIYDYDRRVCVSKVGGPCSITDIHPDTFRNGTNNSKFNPLNFPVIQCISYAECIRLKSDHNHKLSLSPERILSGVCECGESFIETKKGLCSLPLGADCDTSSTNKKDQCADPLKCVSNRCACQNEIDVYEQETRKCAKSVKSLCWKDQTCVKNAECRRRSKTMPGRCKCRPKFRSTFLGTCV